jgi:hypothetical protein
MCHCRACRIGISNLAYSNGDSEVEDFDLDFDVLSPYRDCCPQCHHRIPAKPLDIAGTLNHGGTSFHSQGLETSVCNPTNVSVMSSFSLPRWMEPFNNIIVHFPGTGDWPCPPMRESGNPIYHQLGFVSGFRTGGRSPTARCIRLWRFPRHLRIWISLRKIPEDEQPRSAFA